MYPAPQSARRAGPGARTDVNCEAMSDVHTATQQPTRAVRGDQRLIRSDRVRTVRCAARAIHMALPPADPGCCPRVTESRSGLEWHGSHSAMQPFAAQLAISLIGS